MPPVDVMQGFALAPFVKDVTLFEFIAIGSEAENRWRRILPAGQTVRLGRAPQQGWAVPWDMRISREHADLQLEGEFLHVTCLHDARNAAIHGGAPVRQFAVRAGEDFCIGGTTFRLDRADDSSHGKADTNGADGTRRGVEIEVVALQAEVRNLQQQLEHARQLQASAEAQAEDHAEREKRAGAAQERQAVRIERLENDLAAAINEKHQATEELAEVKRQAGELLRDLRAMEAAEQLQEQEVAARFTELEREIDDLARRMRDMK